MHLRPFEIALIGIFAVLGLVGIFVLSNYEPEDAEEAKLYGDSVEIWGTFDQNTMETFLTSVRESSPALNVVEYIEKD